MPKKIAENKVEKSKVVGDKTFAVINVGGKQYFVKPKDTLLVEKIAQKIGESIKLSDMLSGKEVVVRHIEQQKGKKISIWKFKNKTRRLKRIGHRQKYSKIEVESIK